MQRLPSGTLPALLAFAALALILVASAQEPPSRMLKGARIYDVLPYDAIPSIDDPHLVPVGDVGADRAHPEEPFLGVVIDGEARAYSTWLLERHEVVNDEIRGVPVAATW